jgi:hypothetical protein
MNTKNAPMRRTVLTLTVIGFLILLHACSFQHGRQEVCEHIEQLPLTPVTGQPANLVFEDAGTIKVMQSGKESRFVTILANARMSRMYSRGCRQPRCFSTTRMVTSWSCWRCFPVSRNPRLGLCR